MSKLTLSLNETRRLIDEQFNLLLPLPKGKDARVVEAMRYSAIGGGKAFRPFLVLTIADMLDVPKEYALRVGTALEMVHTYSLIHDDLPAMDNDTLRRGKPTNHVQFDEATAILAGDGLLTYAFEVLSNPTTHPDASVRCRLVEELAKYAGFKGMVGGQMIDLIGEKIPLSLEKIHQMQSLKTGALLTFACTASAILARSNTQTVEALKTYAAAMGLMFQITDDLLDLEGDSAAVGKTLRKDGTANKSTFVSMLGAEAARQMAKELKKTADNALEIFGAKAELLKETTTFILTRNK